MIGQILLLPEIERSPQFWTPILGKLIPVTT